MTSIIEYITQNYFLILFFVVLILLAVIGYFAEKANDKQREKNKEEISNQSDDELDQRNIEGMIFDSHTGKLVKAEEIEKNKENETLIEQTQISNPNEENPNVQQEKITDINIDSSQVSNIEEEQISPSEVGFDSRFDTFNDNEENIVQMNSEDLEQMEPKSESSIKEVQKSDDFIANVNDFDLEFDSLLPKKEIIDTDLLNDIDNLELDKTQKIDLSGIPDLDNIDLPKIKQMPEDDDIWKF